MNKYPSSPILIVDDEEQVLFSIDAALKMAGFTNTLQCKDSREVDKLLSEQTFSAVLLDLVMPYVSGNELLCFINKNYPDVPVLIITGLNDIERAAECLTTGVYDYFIKPFDKTKLISSVRRTIEYQQVRNENKLMKDLLLSDNFVVSNVSQQRGRNADGLRLLQKTREEYKSLFFNMPIPSFVIDTNDYSVMYCNKSFDEFLGFSESQSSYEKMIFLDYIDEGERLRFLNELEEYGKVQNYELNGKRKNGSVFNIILNCRIFKNEGYIDGSFIDITDRKNLEEQLRQSQKMEPLGRLVGGVAHDFNNILTVIIGYSKVIMMDQKIPGIIKDRIQEIKKASEKAALLIRQLLSFSRKRMGRLEKISLNSLIIDLEKMLRRLLKENISFQINLEAKNDAIKVDRVQIEQVLMNLVVNAMDAMPDGGNIVIETQNIYLDDDYCRKQYNVIRGPYVMMSVSDTGHGMDEETIEKIFDPFFTTKKRGEGTGLGLSTVFGIVKHSGGHIRILSKLNTGTTFKIYLPQSSKRIVQLQTLEQSQEQLNEKGS